MAKGRGAGILLAGASEFAAVLFRLEALLGAAGKGLAATEAAGARDLLLDLRARGLGDGSGVALGDIRLRRFEIWKDSSGRA